MGFKLAAIMGVILLSTLGGFSWYYKDTQARMAILVENAVKLESAVKTNEETISSLQKDYAKISSENKRINDEYAAIRRQNNILSDKLANIDLGLLAAQKPDSIERAINRGTANALRCFELLSGAELTEDEKNAKDGITFNKECPWLWTGSSTDGVQSTDAPANTDKRKTGR